MYNINNTIYIHNQGQRSGTNISEWMLSSTQLGGGKIVKTIKYPGYKHMFEKLIA